MMSNEIILSSVAIFVLLFAPISANHQVLNKILDALNKNLDYISINHKKINVDCLYGVVLAENFLTDVLKKCPVSIYHKDIDSLRKKSENTYRKARPFMENQSTWKFAKYIADPNLYKNRSINFEKGHSFKIRKPQKSLVDAIFHEDAYKNFSEGFSDYCISSIINQTLNLDGRKSCYLSPKCENEFIGNLENGPGYVKTHKLLLLQIAKQRKCKLPEESLDRAVKILCSRIYQEMTSIEYYRKIGATFDLFLEQGILCGSEGFTDFLKTRYLSVILKTQKYSGCFPTVARNEKNNPRITRNVNYFQDGCADHPTGLGAAILSLYLNYFLKTTYCPLHDGIIRTLYYNSLNREVHRTNKVC